MRRVAAIVIWAVTLLLLAVAVVMSTLGDFAVAASLGTAVALAVWATIAAVVTTRQADNKVGWLLLAAGFFGGVNLFGEEIAVYATVDREMSLAIGQAWLALAGVSFILMLASLSLLFLVFPTGRLISTRWRPAAWLVLTTYAFNAVYTVVLVSWVLDIEDFLNSVWSLDNTGQEVPLLLRVLEPVGTVLVMATFAIGAAAMFYRLRKSGGVERQQVKWVVYLGAVSAALGVAFFIPGTPAALRFTFSVALGLALAAGFAIALLKYRLYDIDRLINRTVVYAGVVAVLVGVYAAGVFLLREVLPGEGDLAVAASTLAVAALFNPLRKRVQGFVDRRFYRSRYDAQLVIDQFSTRLRDELDLVVLTEEWLAVVNQAVKPKSADVWLRENEGAVR